MQIIHGDNQIASRAHYLGLKKKAESAGQQVVTLSGDSLTLSELVNSSSSTSLLGTEIIVFIEGLFSRRPSNEKKALLSFLELHLDVQIYTWDDKDLSTQVKNYPVKNVTKFDLPKYVFQFIDTFSLPLFHKSLESSEPEMILGMLAKRISELMIVKTNPGHFPSWLSTKLKQQASKLSDDKLTLLSQQLLDIDYAQKTSTSPLNLKSSLEVWLVRASI